MDLFAAEIGMDPAEVRRKNLIPVDVHRSTTRRARVRQRRLRGGAGPRARPRPVTPSCGPSRRAGASAATRSSSASGVASTSRSPRRAESGRRDGAASRSTGRQGDRVTGTSPHGQGHARPGRCSSSERLGIPMENIEVIHGDTDPIPEGGGTAVRGRCSSAARRCTRPRASCVEQARRAGRRHCSRPAADLELDIDSRLAGARRPGDRAGLGAIAELAGDERPGRRGTSTPAAPTFPFGAHVAVVEVDTETGKARLVPHRGRRRRGADPQPAARRGPAARRHRPGRGPGPARGGPLRRRRQPVDRELADYASSRRPSCRASSWSPWRRRPRQRARGQGHRRVGHHRLDPGRAERRHRRLAHLGVRHMDMPATPERVWAAIQRSAGQSAGEGRRLPSTGARSRRRSRAPAAARAPRARGRG